MSAISRIASLPRIPALSLALALPAMIGAATAARADDEYGTNRSPVVLQSAQSARFADPNATPLAAATAQARISGVAVATAASRAPVVSGQDLVGQGGAQDDLARATYHPGSGTDW